MPLVCTALYSWDILYSFSLTHLTDEELGPDRGSGWNESTELGFLAGALPILGPGPSSTVLFSTFSEESEQNRAWLVLDLKEIYL